MRRFLSLLEPTPTSTPMEEQRRASEGLADAVAQSRLLWWEGRVGAAPRGKVLLLAVAPYSRYDLALLDLIDERLDGGQPPTVPVYVANLQDYVSLEQLAADFPGAAAVQTPLAAVWQDGAPSIAASGRKARDLAADAVGLPADEVSRRVQAESPGHVNATGRG